MSPTLKSDGKGVKRPATADSEHRSRAEIRLVPQRGIDVLSGWPAGPTAGLRGVGQGPGDSARRGQQVRHEALELLAGYGEGHGGHADPAQRPPGRAENRG